MNIAEVKLSCGRLYLSVSGIIVAMEGDKCRQILPKDVAEPVPEKELELANVGGVPAKDLSHIQIQFFRGDVWTEKSLEWAADKINKELMETK